MSAFAIASDTGPSGSAQLAQPKSKVGRVVTDQEKEWVAALKYAVDQEDGLELRNDWEAFRFARICEGDTAMAVKRLKNVRSFHEKFKLDKIDSMDAFDRVAEKIGLGLSQEIGINAENQVLLLSRMADFQPSFLTEDFLPYLCKNLYDVFYTSATSLEEFDAGVVMITDCKGFGWKNFSLKLEKEFAWTYQEGFPFKAKSFLLYRAGPIMKAVIKMCKVFMSKKIQKRIQLVNKEMMINVIPEKIIPIEFDIGGEGNSSPESRKEIFANRLKKFAAMEQSFTI